MVADLAREYGIPAVRLAREDWRTTLALAPDGPCVQNRPGPHFCLAWPAGPRAWPGPRVWSLMTISSGSRTTDGMTEAYLTGLMSRLQPGVTEIYLHPGLAADPELTRWAPRLSAPGGTGGPLSPHLKAALAAAGVRLTDFRELSLRQQYAGELVN